MSVTIIPFSLLLIPVIVIIVYVITDIAIYNKSSYKAITHNSYFTTMNDKGKKGEYQLYRALQHYEEHGFRFLFNVYLRKPNGATSELDVVMIGSNGVIVFEIKNYSGWIFGNDKQKYWTQVIYKRKYRFLNPVWQNRTHCEVLRGYLPEDTAVYSVVLFSYECELKDIKMHSPDVIVARLQNANGIVQYLLNLPVANIINVEQVYNRLYPYSQVSDEMKQFHVEQIAKKK